MYGNIQEVSDNDEGHKAKQDEREMMKKKMGEKMTMEKNDMFGEVRIEWKEDPECVQGGYYEVMAVPKPLSLKWYNYYVARGHRFNIFRRIPYDGSMDPFWNDRYEPLKLDEMVKGEGWYCNGKDKPCTGIGDSEKCKQKHEELNWNVFPKNEYTKAMAMASQRMGCNGYKVYERFVEDCRQKGYFLTVDDGPKWSSRYDDMARKWYDEQERVKKLNEEILEQTKLDEEIKALRRHVRQLMEEKERMDKVRNNLDDLNGKKDEKIEELNEKIVNY